MPGYGYATARPDICIKHSSTALSKAVCCVQLGMEEEGIPFHASVGDGDATQLAWQAAGESRLGVGVGVDDKKVVMSFAKLEADKPLFYALVSSGDEAVRSVGANAARLVKRVPFRMGQASVCSSSTHRR